MHYVVALILLLVSVEHTAAAELLVDPSSCGDNNTFCEIQDAVDAAAENDTILLRDSTYELWQQSITISKSLTLKGQSQDKTLLLGEGHGPSALIIVTSGAENVSLENLTIADRVVVGSPAMGPGGMDFRGGDLSINNVTFKNNRGGWGGGARVISLFGTVHINNTRFINNTAFAGGGLAIYDGSALDLLIENSQFSGNNAIFSGGALLMRDAAEVVLSSVDVQGNTAGNTGGGVHAFTNTGAVSLTVTGSTIESNEASKIGGLSAKGTNISVSLENSNLQGNRSRDGLPEPDCGGMSFELIGNNNIDQSNHCQTN